VNETPRRDTLPRDAAHATALSIGGITFRIVADDPLLASSREYDALERFSVAAAHADVHVRAAWSDAPPDVCGDLIFDSGGSWDLRRQNGLFTFSFRSASSGAMPYKIGTFDPTFTSGDVRLHRAYFTPGHSVYPMQYPLDELVMVHLLSQGKGIELHGCAILDARRRAYVFPGQSGAGKSTMARLWAHRSDVTLLSDERVIVRTDADRPTVYGTPWHGDALLASPQSGELAGVFFLKHHPTHAVAPVAGPLSAARLLSGAFLPFHSAEGVANTVAAADRIARDVPCHELRFAPDRSVVDIVAAHMG